MLINISMTSIGHKADINIPRQSPFCSYYCPPTKPRHAHTRHYQPQNPLPATKRKTHCSKQTNGINGGAVARPKSQRQPPHRPTAPPTIRTPKATDANAWWAGAAVADPHPVTPPQLPNNATSHNLFPWLRCCF